MSICEKCKHYINHFSVDNGRVHRVFCGHCTVDCRQKTSFKRVCNNFEEGENKTYAEFRLLCEFNKLKEIFNAVNERLNNIQQTIDSHKINLQ